MRVITTTTLLLFALQATAQAGYVSEYTDAAGDIPVENANLDIVSAMVSHTDSSLTISMTVADLNADWGKYMVLIDTGILGGDHSNPWGRDITYGDGINVDFALGSWLDNGGGTTGLMSWDSMGGWGYFYDVEQSIDWDNDTVSWTIDAGGFFEFYVNSSEGYGGFEFDIVSTGGGDNDPAIDFMGGEGIQGGWGNGSTMTDMFTYTLPAPGALALLGLAGLAGRSRRRH